jgi:hypothetical protein
MLKEGQQYRSQGVFTCEMYIQKKSFHEFGAFYFLRILSVNDVMNECTIQSIFCYPHREIGNIKKNPESKFHALFIFFHFCLYLDIRLSPVTGKPSDPTDSYYILRLWK